MPVYEYKCPYCGTFERFYKMDKFPRTTKCPTCKKRSEKQISMPGKVHDNTFIPGYKDSVARYPGDPQGWCKTKEEVIRKVTARGIPREAIIFKGEEDRDLTNC